MKEFKSNLVFMTYHDSILSIECELEKDDQIIKGFCNFPL